jgi:hypothetical protein
MADMNLKLALPLIEAIADWETENGTLAAILPSEYGGFMVKLANAAIKGSARAALSDEEDDDRAYRPIHTIKVGDSVALLPDEHQPQDSDQMRWYPNSSLALGDAPLIVAEIALTDHHVMIRVESSFKLLHLERFYMIHPYYGGPLDAD